MKNSLISGAAFLCASLFATSAFAARTDSWTPAPEKWNTTHSLRILVAFEPNAKDCTSGSCQYANQTVQVDGTSRNVRRHNDHRTIVNPWVDHMNAMFRLSGVPIRADLVDVLLLDKPIAGELDTLTYEISQDKLLRQLKETSGAQEVIVVTDRTTTMCGDHTPGAKGSFQAYGWVKRTSTVCDSLGFTGKRTFALHIGHGMGLNHDYWGAVSNGMPGYASGAATTTWVTTMEMPRTVTALSWKDTWSDTKRKCDSKLKCGGQNNYADAARYLRETASQYLAIKPYKLINQTNKKCLDFKGGVSKGKTVITNTCTGSVSQQFRWHADKTIMVDGLCLDQSKFQMKAPIVAKVCSGAPSQKWWMDEIGRIRSSEVGGCMDLEEKSGTIVLWTCDAPHTDQQFTKS